MKRKTMEINTIILVLIVCIGAFQGIAIKNSGIASASEILWDLYDFDYYGQKPWHGFGVLYWQMTEIGADTDEHGCIICPAWDAWSSGTTGAGIFAGWSLTAHLWYIGCSQSYAYRKDDCQYTLSALGSKVTLQTGWVTTLAEIFGCRSSDKNGKYDYGGIYEKMYKQSMSENKIIECIENSGQIDIDVGDWIKLDVSSSINEIDNISTVQYTVTGVGPSEITFDALFKFVNGTQANTTLSLDPSNGNGSATYVLIHQNLDVGEPLYDNSNFSVSEITTMNLPGGEREVVRSTVTEPILNLTADAYWDRETGFIVQINESLIVYEPNFDNIYASLNDWSFKADLGCDGSLSCTDVTPGATVTDSFTIENIASVGGIGLDWEIKEWPPWGTWSFSPSSGTGLAAGSWVTVTATVVAPNQQNKNFSGKVKVVNSDDPSDYCEIDVSLATPKNKAFNIFPPFLQFLQNHPHMFPILRRMLGI